LKKPQYSLLLLKDTSDVNYFSNADPKTNKEEALLWQIIKDNPKCFAEKIEHAEKRILENPLYVFFASKLASWKIKNYPCLIDTTSSVLSVVILCFWRYLLKILLDYWMKIASQILISAS